MPYRPTDIAALAARVSTRIGTLLIAATVFAGCGTDTGAPEPNFPPETEITSVPNAGDRFSVHHILREPHTIQYRGSDNDGTVFSYEYLVHTYPRSVSSEDEITVPTPSDDDPRWTTTTLARVDITLLADTLRADPRGDIGNGTYDRWHTFFVRAIDNEGSKDPSPDFRTLRAYTTGPQMMLLTPPVVVGQATELPVTFGMLWDGFDDGHAGTTRSPLEVRWTLVPAELDASDQPIGFPEALYDLPQSSWSAWFLFDDPDGSGREVHFFDTIATQRDSNFVFAVQGRDDAGAVTPQFKLDAPFENNMAVLKVRSSIRSGPWLTLHTEPDLGSYAYEGIGSAAQVASAVGVDQVAITWEVMVTTHYGGRPGEYRWGWNVDSEGDWSDWSRGRSAPAFTLTNSTEKFEVQARDSLGQITTATLFFQK